jgi:putative exosortase-associated protein (TIGR04073 family)
MDTAGNFKKIVVTLAGIVACLCVSVCASYGQDAQEQRCETQPFIDTQHIKYQRTPVNKLGRGAVNTITCWMEVPAEMYRVSKEKNVFVGTTLGFLEGICTSVLRLGTGLADMVTFFAPPYDKPFMEPEYAFDDVKQRSEEYERENR